MPETIAILEAEVLDHQEVAAEHYVLTLDARDREAPTLRVSRLP